MKALSTLKSAIDQSSFAGIAALVLLIPVLQPQLVSAAQLQTSEQSTAQVFEINVSDPSMLESAPKPNTTSQTSVNIDAIKQADPLVTSLDAYLKDHDSPLAGSADKIVDYPNWQLALSISLVESHMCEFTPMVKTKQGWVQSYNCSGVGGGEHYRVYDSYLGWLDDMNGLLSQPNYANRPIEKFIGYYVQPGSISWLYGVKKTDAELIELANQAQIQRQQLAQAQVNTGPITTALATFPENTN